MKGKNLNNTFPSPKSPINLLTKYISGLEGLVTQS